MNRKGILACLLLAAMLLAPCARAAEGDRNFLRDDAFFQALSGYPSGGCAVGDALYLYTDAHIYVWRAGDEMPSAAACALPEGAEGESRAVASLFASGESLYALCGVFAPGDGGEPSLAGLEIAQVTVGGDAATFGDAVEVPMDGLTESYGDERALAPIFGAAAAGDALALDIWTDAGRRLYLQPLSGGAGEFLDLENVAGLCAYDGDRLLIETYDAGRRERAFLIYDPAAEALTPACAPAQEAARLCGIARSTESGRLFYLEDGYVMAAEDFDFDSAQPVAELCARYPEEAACCLLRGDRYVYIDGYDGVCVRSTAAGALPQERVVVQGGGIFRSMMDAYYAFNASHDGAAVVLREDYADDGAVLNDIMSRDDSVDVRVTMASSELFSALRERGYLAPLDDAALTEAVGGMYPAIRDALTLDGAVVAVPVYVACWTLGLDYEGFEKLGIPRDEMPDNWQDFLKLLPALPELLPGDGTVRIFPEYVTQAQVRTELIDAILDSWLMHLRANGLAPCYDSPELAALLDRVMALDLDALGVSRGGEDEEYVMVSVAGNYAAGAREYTLINTNNDSTLTGMGYNEPALLSAVPGEEAPLPLDLAVVFVNPFSKHADLAQEYLAAVYENLDEADLYSLSDARSAPLEDPAYARDRAAAAQKLADARKQLASAAPEDAPRWEEIVAQAEAQLERVEANRWRISPERLAWYRALGGRLAVKEYSYVDVTDPGGEFADLIQQFLSGRTDAAHFLAEIDRRVQMKLREET